MEVADVDDVIASLLLNGGVCCGHVSYAYVAGNPLNASDPSGQRPADFYMFQVSAFIFSFTVVQTSYGDTFINPGAMSGKSWTLEGGVWAGWVDPSTVVMGTAPTREQLNQFISGLSVQGDVAFGGGVGFMWGNPGQFHGSDTAILLGVSTPQLGGGVDFGIGPGQCPGQFGIALYDPRTCSDNRPASNRLGVGWLCDGGNGVWDRRSA